jgi:signal transduction histidine kinase
MRLISKIRECHNARLKVHYVDGYLTFELQDDGKGFDINKLTFKSGLKNIVL